MSGGELVVFIEHRGKRILLLDCKNGGPDVVMDMIQKAKPIISAQPPESLLTLTDVRGIHFNKEATSAIKEFVSQNKPYVKAAAVVGISGLKEVVFKAVAAFTGRQIATFDSIEDAKDWLSMQ